MASSGGTESMERHPDILEMRERFERIGASPPAQTAEGLLFLAAGYAAVSGWVVGFHDRSPALTVVNLITGVTLMLLTVGFAASYGRTYGMAWVTPLLGAWLIVAPWAVQHTDRATSLIVNNAVMGGCIALFGLVLLIVAMAGRTPTHHRRLALHANRDRFGNASVERHAGDIPA